MSLRWVVGEFLTGKIVADLGVSSGSWSSVLNDTGHLQAVVPLAQYDNPSGVGNVLNVRDVTAPWRSFLAAIDNKTKQVFAAGPIVDRGWDDDSQQITLNAAGMWVYWGRRILAPKLTANQNISDVTSVFSGLTHGGIAASIINQTITFTGGTLPIDVPTAAAGPFTNTYPGYNASLVSDELTDLIQLVNGPDIMFFPYLSNATHIRWTMKVGNEANPLVFSSGIQVFNYTAPVTTATGLQITEDSSRMTGQDFEMGNDGNALIISGTASNSYLLDHGWPLLQSSATRPTVSQQSDLIDYAKDAVLLGVSPNETWTIVFQTTERPFPTSYSVGDFAVLTITDHRWIPDGNYAVRIVGTSGTEDNQTIGVSFQLQSGAVYPVATFYGNAVFTAEGTLSGVGH